MKILFNSYAYPNAAQPQLATFNQTLLSGLAQDHAVRVVAPVPFLQRLRRSPSPPGYSALPDVPAVYPPFYYPPRVLRTRFDDFLWWSTRHVLRQTIADFQPDVVLSYWAHPDGAVAVRAAREAGIPAVVTVGGSDVLVLGRRGARRRAILRTLGAADHVIAVSEDLAETLRQDGINASRISVVPRGVDHRKFHPGDQTVARQQLGLPLDRDILLGVGRLVEVKDWPMWIAACARLHDNGRKIACYILGEGPLREPLIRLIEQSGMTGIIHLCGSQSQSQLALWYRAASLTVLSSRSEGIPNVLLETLASGGSFVATHVGGIGEIADPIADRLVPPAQPQFLAEAIRDRLDDTPPAGYQRRYQPLSQAESARRVANILGDCISPPARKKAAQSHSPLERTLVGVH